MKSRIHTIAAAVTVGLLAVSMATPAQAAPKPKPVTSNTVKWTGKGAVLNGSTWTLPTQTCNVSKTPFLTFQLSASQSKTATITFDGTTQIAMVKTNGDKNGYSTLRYTWKPAVTSIALTPLVNLVAAKSDTMGKNPQLILTSGCLGA